MNIIIMMLLVCVMSLKSVEAEAAPSWFNSFFGIEKSDDDKDRHDDYDRDSEHHEHSEKEKHKHKHEKHEEADEKHEHKSDKHSNKRKGPPDHAKAHGYRSKFKHYPDSDIYENTQTGVYYQKQSDQWAPLYTIPSNINLGNGVSVDLEAAIPAAIRALSGNK